jgi:putative hemolysin
MDILLLATLILLNGLFAMSEISLVTARKARMQRYIDEGDKGAAAAVELGQNPNRFLSTIQIGITLIGVLNGIVGEAALAEPLSRQLQDWHVPDEYARYVATGMVVLMITYFTIVVGELVPKRIGQTHPERLARLVARPIEWMALVAKPFVWLLTLSTQLLLRLLGVKESGVLTVTEEEIHAVIAEGTSAGIIETQEHAMVRNVFRLDDRPIASLMVPRNDVAYLDTSATFEKNLATVAAAGHSMFPVVEGSLEKLLGVVDVRCWLAGALSGEDRELTTRIEPAMFIPESLTGMELLERFRDSSMRMAFVVSEYGEVEGVVTLHDLVEAITGEFRPHDPEDLQAVQRADGSWLLDGQIPLPELKDLLELDAVPEEERGRYHTLSGMMLLLLGRIPREADAVNWEDWRFEIVDMDGKRIDKVLASAMRPAAGANGHAH